MAIIKIAKLWPGGHRGGAAQPVTVPIDPDGLGAFGSEEAPPRSGRSAGVLALAPNPASAAPPVTKAPKGSSYLGPLKWALVILLSGAAAAAGMWGYQRRQAAGPAVSDLTVETTPPNLEVTIAGKVMGRTPLTMNLPPGPYEIALGSGPQRRVIQATLAPGVSLVQRVEIAETPVVASTGSLLIETEPARLPVQVDGVDKGMSPLTIAALSPGEHQVVVRTEGGSVRRTVSVQANQTVSLVISGIDRPSASAGWLTVAAPIALQFRENGKVIGSTDVERVMLPSGDHTLELVNESLGYRAQRRVSVTPGGTARLTLDVPKGTVSINAQPWAEVWLDGQRLGETPIGNWSVPIGSHEVVFRHPELGERRETVVVTTKQPARIGIDMRKK